jgi:hypothetical protein
MKAGIDKILRDMSKLRGREAGAGKGDMGEAAVLQILRLHKKRLGRRCVIFQSYTYPYALNVEGNIKLNPEGIFIHEPGKSGTNDEIDIVMLTDNRIFLIEVKAYSGKILVNDIWTYHANHWDEKSAICQAEKHGRHFYHSFYDVIPEGEHKYIKLITVFTGSCDIEDKRTVNKDYIPIAVANDINKTIHTHDIPDRFSIDIDAVVNRMLEYKTDVKAVLM